MKRIVPGIVIAGIFFLTGILTLSDYGMHEDNPFHFLRGQYFLERILGRDGTFPVSSVRSPVLFMPLQRISSYKINASEELMSLRLPVAGADDPVTVQAQFRSLLEKEGVRSSFYKNNAWGRTIWDISSNQGHPAISDMLMAMSNRLLYEKLGWLPDIEAYQVYTLFVVSVSLVFFYMFVSDAFGVFAAVLATVALATYPSVFAESHFNVKDPVQMGYFTMAVTGAYFTVTRRLSVDWLVVTILSVFLALGTKWNILFLPFIILPWTAVAVQTGLKGKISRRRLFLFGLILATVPFILLIVAYPFYWSHTFYKLLNTFDFYASLSVKDLRIEKASPADLPAGLDARAILRIIFESPPFVLLFAAAGVVAVILRKIPGKHKAGLLVLLWLTVPFLRVIWRTSELWGAIRNFTECIPAIAVLAGIGGALLVKKRLWQIVCVGVFLALHIYILTSWHPYEHVYFNSAAGSIVGAQKAGMYDWETLYDAPYRAMATWMNEHAEKGAHIAYLDGTMLAMSPLWLRDDIRIGSYFSGLDGQGEYILSVLYSNPPSVFPINYLNAYVTPVYEITVHGVPVARIWKNDAAHTKLPKMIDVTPEVMTETSFIADSAKQTDTRFQTGMRIIKATVDVSDIRCLTVRNFVWGILDGDMAIYTIPWVSHIEGNSAELWFPGIPGDGIRAWDREQTRCDVKIRGVQGVPEQ